MMEKLREILFIGAGSPLSRLQFNVSIVLNGHIILEAPPGVDKQLLRYRVLPENIDLMLLSHLHGDHILGVPQYLHHIAFPGVNAELTIVGPKGTRSVIEKIVDLTFPGELERLVKNLTFIELEGEKGLIEEPYPIKYVELKHSVKNYGYIIRFDNASVGYTGDTTLCDNLYKLIEESDIVLIDTTMDKTTKLHLGVGDVENIAERFPEKKFFLVHRGREIDNIIPKGYNIYAPFEGDKVIF